MKSTEIPKRNESKNLASHPLIDEYRIPKLLGLLGMSRIKSEDPFHREIHDEEVSLSSSSASSSQCSSSNGYNNGIHDEQLQVFGNVLRQSLSRRQQQQQQQQPHHHCHQKQQHSRSMFSSFWTTDLKHETETTTLHTGSAVSIQKNTIDNVNEEGKSFSSIATSPTVQDDAGSDNLHDAITQRQVQNLLVSLRNRLLSCWMIPTNERQDLLELGPNDDCRPHTVDGVTMRWNWDRIIKLLTVLVALEMILVVSLLVALVGQDAK
ncbi:hypothetical protein IV203_016431 [Nitzschia inconspicua]|uniref:Uncharacterized protein n=1 Tax=Nitzschia inconspicua TaxID=303405 RepID=A0A9K3PI80_9STRA|nr:hypothetical protein IV203_016431 [Nitzschia inconspicua]